MPIYHSQISPELKRKFLSYMLNRHGKVMAPNTELTNREALALDLCRQNDLHRLGIDTSHWRMHIKQGSRIHRDFVADRLGVSRSTVARIFTSLEKKGRVFYYRQFGEIGYIPDMEEVVLMPATKLAINYK